MNPRSLDRSTSQRDPQQNCWPNMDGGMAGIAVQPAVRANTKLFQNGVPAGIQRTRFYSRHRNGAHGCVTRLGPGAAILISPAQNGY